MGTDRETESHTEITDGRTLSGRQKILLLAENIGVTALIAWIFYDSFLGCLVFPLIAVLNTRRMLGEAGENFSKQLEIEYREMFTSITGSLQTGYSIERAFVEAAESLRMLYGDRSVLRPHIVELNSKVRLRKPVEQAFSELAEKFDNEDLSDFAQIFRFGKRLGGEYVNNIRKSTERISKRVEVKQEIRASIAQQQLELKVMSVMPLGILAYMKISAPEFLNPSYGNVIGIVTMTGCLALYAGCLILGKKITDIKV